MGLARRWLSANQEESSTWELTRTATSPKTHWLKPCKLWYLPMMTEMTKMRMMKAVGIFLFAHQWCRDSVHKLSKCSTTDL